jgi:hypothetical protein
MQRMHGVAVYGCAAWAVRQLYVLSLRQNKLGGPLPVAWANPVYAVFNATSNASTPNRLSSSLSQLYLDTNDFEGTFPDTWSPGWTNLSQWTVFSNPKLFGSHPMLTANLPGMLCLDTTGTSIGENEM